MRIRVATAPILALAAIIPITEAHGYVDKIIVGDRTYEGSNPEWIYNATQDVVDTPGWFAYNQQAEFISGTGYRNHAITCHKGGSPGSLSARVEAGSQVTLRWIRWPQDHQGLVFNYLAKCSGSCLDAQSESLNFFKIDEDGLYNGTAPDGDPGIWATNRLIEQKYHWTTTVPLNIEPGHYVLRHEVVSLHEAFRFNGAQHYPQCINLEVTNSDGVDPCTAGADCRKGTELYDAYHPGFLINIYHGVPSSYTIPGPPVWSGLNIPMHRETASATTPPVPSKTQVLWGQCSGRRYRGPTICPDNSACVYVNEWYWHCDPTA